MIKAIQIINTLVIISSIVVFSVGCSIMPQTVTNDGDVYIGDAQSYNRDLHKVQINSYGFKLIMIGIGMFGGTIISCCCVCYRCKKEEITHVHTHVRVAPLPIAIEIL